MDSIDVENNLKKEDSLQDCPLFSATYAEKSTTYEIYVEIIAPIRYTASREGGNQMEIEIKLDGAYKRPKVIVLTHQMSEEVHEIVKRLSREEPQLLVGIRDDRLEVLEEESILRVYGQKGKVFAVTGAGEYALRLRLYELEERLDQRRFVRISNSEIINLKQVKSFDLSLTGSICVALSNGEVAYVSRRYMQKIKQILGL